MEEEYRYLIAVPLLGEIFPVVLNLTDHGADQWRKEGYWVARDSIRAREEIARKREVRNATYYFPVPILV